MDHAEDLGFRSDKFGAALKSSYKKLDAVCTCMKHVAASYKGGVQ